MKADDARHGSYAGAVQHWLDNETACAPCRKEGTRYHKRRQLRILSGEQARVASIGYQRRVQALQAIGYSIPALSVEAGVPVPTLRNLILYRTGRMVSMDTARKIAAAYERLRDEPVTGHYPDRDRGLARRKGWPTPDRWFDIDDPDERPDPGYSERTTMSHASRKDIDEVIVERILAGDMSLANSTSRAEKVAVVARWSGSMKELERQTGWKTDRYRTERAA